jgi:hypothetical protein
MSMNRLRFLCNGSLLACGVAAMAFDRRSAFCCQLGIPGEGLA